NSPGQSLGQSPVRAIPAVVTMPAAPPVPASAPAPLPPVVPSRAPVELPPLPAPVQTAVLPEAPLPVAEPARPDTVEHEVRRGDTLTGIMRTHALAVDPPGLARLREINPEITNPDHLIVGQRILLPTDLRAAR